MNQLRKAAKKAVSASQERMMVCLRGEILKEPPLEATGASVTVTLVHIIFRIGSSNSAPPFLSSVISLWELCRLRDGGGSEV